MPAKNASGSFGGGGQNWGDAAKPPSLASVAGHRAWGRLSGDRLRLLFYWSLATKLAAGVLARAGDAAKPSSVRHRPVESDGGDPQVGEFWRRSRNSNNLLLVSKLVITNV